VNKENTEKPKVIYEINGKRKETHSFVIMDFEGEGETLGSGVSSEQIIDKMNQLYEHLQNGGTDKGCRCNACINKNKEKEKGTEHESNFN
jgi:hypothetical protein